MPTLPDMSRIPRVVLIEEDLSAAQSVLAHLANAGLDCRYLPLEAAGRAMLEDINPHILIVSALRGGAADATARKLCSEVRRYSQIPILVLTPANADLAPWRDLQLGVGYIFERDGLPQAVLERVAERLQNVYQETALLQVAEERSRTGPGPQLRQGWHTCHSCGYIGPREKFINPDRHSAHYLKCPACHNTDNIEFSVAVNGPPAAP